MIVYLMLTQPSINFAWSDLFFPFVVWAGSFTQKKEKRSGGSGVDGYIRPAVGILSINDETMQYA